MTDTPTSSHGRVANGSKSPGTTNTSHGRQYVSSMSFPFSELPPLKRGKVWVSMCPLTYTKERPNGSYSHWLTTTQGWFRHTGRWRYDSTRSLLMSYAVGYTTLDCVSPNGTGLVRWQLIKWWSKGPSSTWESRLPRLGKLRVTHMQEAVLSYTRLVEYADLCTVLTLTRPTRTLSHNYRP